MITIALDAMGGDHGVSVTVPAALATLRHQTTLKLILVGQRETIETELRRHRTTGGDRIVIHHASEVVGMDEPPAQALRSKKDSSMRVAINLVKEGVAQAAVSAGNTGALMATARFVLKTLPGIDRPAIITTLPDHARSRARAGPGRQRGLHAGAAVAVRHHGFDPGRRRGRQVPPARGPAQRGRGRHQGQ